MLDCFAHLSARQILVQTPLAAVVQELEQALQNQELTLVLADGDPLLFGLGSTLLRHLPRQRLCFYPNVSTLQTAAARLGLPWQNIPVHSLHGRKDLVPVLRSLTWHSQVALFTDHEFSPDLLARKLLSRGAHQIQLAVCQNLCSPRERVDYLTPEQAAQQSFAELSFVILHRRSEPEIQPVLGLEDHCFVHQRGLLTKKEIRVLGLSQLAVQSRDVVWDLGSGCGSVAIEACCLAWQGRVHAVEKNAERCAQIRENIQRTGTFFIQLHNMDINRALEELPAPQRIFIGGGLQQEPDLLPGLWARLQAPGRIVAHIVLLGSLKHILDFCRDNSLQPELIQAQVSRGTALAGDLRLAAQNPVYIVTLEKKE